MHIRLALDSDRETWNQFITNSSSGSFLQTWEWGHMQQLLGVSYWRYIGEEQGNWKSVALVLKRDLPFGFSWLYVPGGPVFSSNEHAKDDFAIMQQAISKLAQDERASFIRIDPLITDAVWQAWHTGEWRKAEREVQPRHTQILKLDPTEEELLSRMHSKTRYNIRLAERKGVRVRFSTSLHDVDTFLTLSHEVSARSGFHYHPDNYYRALVAAHAPQGAVELAIAEYNEQPLAVHIMMYANSVATYVHGASSHAHRSLMAPILTYWETMKRAKEKGMRAYDFFGVAPPGAAKGHPWSGITRVKQGFGGETVSYMGAYDYVVNENSYSFLNTARRLRSLIR